MKILHFVGQPLVKLNVQLRGGQSKVQYVHSHQESWSPMHQVNKDVSVTSVIHRRDVGFVAGVTCLSERPSNTPVDLSSPTEYFQLVDKVLKSGVPNYKAVRTPLPSAFNLDFIEHMAKDYHDKQLLEYLTYGFPLNISRPRNVSSAHENHHSANVHSSAVDDYIQSELQHGALLGPFDTIPHPCYTWSPLLTRPKGEGRRVILDLSFGEASVNNATIKDSYDGLPFQLKLPSLDSLLPALNCLGENARLFKIDISRAFRNVRIDPGDAIHLGISWGVNIIWIKIWLSGWSTGRAFSRESLISLDSYWPRRALKCIIILMTCMHAYTKIWQTKPFQS